MNSIEQLEKELKHHLAVTSFGGFEFNVTEWLEKYKSAVKESSQTQHFIKPTDDELIDFALVYNEGKIEKQKLASMIGFCSMVVNRLYDRGVINKKSDEEIEIEKEDNKGDVAL